MILPSAVDPTLLDPTVQRSGTFAGANGSLAYGFNRQTSNASFSTGAVAAVADYSVTPHHPSYNFAGNAALSTRLANKMTFGATGGAYYSPYYGLGTLANPGGFDPVSTTPNFAFAAVPAQNIGTNATIELADNFTKRSSLGVNFSYTETIFLDHTIPNNRGWNGRATLSHRLTRKIGAHAGYGRGKSYIVGSGETAIPMQSVDAGIDYADSLTLNRRTTLSFGSSLAGAGSPPGGGIHYAIVGFAALTRGIGRTWSTSLNFNRSLSFPAGFRQPVTSDTLTASLNGQLLSRVSWNSTAGYTRGAVGFETPQHFTTYYATSGLAFGIARRVSAYAQYSYYNFHVPTGLTTFDLFSRLGRQSVAAGISLYQPLLNGQRNRH